MIQTRLLTWIAIVPLAVVFGTTQASLIITGVYDGPLPDGDPKGVELFATATIADLSRYGIGTGNNGAGTAGVEDILPAAALPAGSFYYVANAADGDFMQWFGFEPDFVASRGGVNHNGNDGIELFFDSSGAFAGTETLMDEFGDVNIDGEGQPWHSLDGWAYRNNGVPANAGAFNPTNWGFPGINAWDGDDNIDGGTDNGTNATSTPPFPTGTYTAGTATLAGDANNDGLVTGADLISVQQNFGNAGPPNDGTLEGDANDDGLVTGADLISVQQNFGNALGATVPEPAAWVATMVVALVVWRRAG